MQDALLGFRCQERLKPTAQQLRTRTPFWLLFGKAKSNWTAYEYAKKMPISNKRDIPNMPPLNSYKNERFPHIQERQCSSSALN